jgi:hypothetical protein
MKFAKGKGQSSWGYAKFYKSFRLICLFALLTSEKKPETELVVDTVNNKNNNNAVIDCDRETSLFTALKLLTAVDLLREYGQK